jgi:hypothetical protein
MSPWGRKGIGPLAIMGEFLPGRQKQQGHFWGF